METTRRALVIGATGLIGKNVITRLLESDKYDEIRVICRSQCPWKHKKIIQLIINFDDLSKHSDHFAVDDVYCAFGTTMAQAGGKEYFKMVDYDYVMMAARLAKENSVKRFILISSQGANEKSKNFYLKTKGELERDIQQLNLTSLDIFRPSLLLGFRQEKRPREKMAALGLNVLRLFPSKFSQNRLPISASMVAYSMVKVAFSSQTGFHVYSSGDIKDIAMGKYAF